MEKGFFNQNSASKGLSAGMNKGFLTSTSATKDVKLVGNDAGNFRTMVCNASKVDTNVDYASGLGKSTPKIGIVVSSDGSVNSDAPTTCGTSEGKGNVSGKEQSFASLLGANSTSHRVNFRQMVNEDRVPNHDTKLPKEVMEPVLDEYAAQVNDLPEQFKEFKLQGRAGKAEQKFYHLEEALPEAPAANASAAVRNAYTCRCNEQQEVACLMLASMIPELQKNLENRAAFDMLRELKVMFEQQAEQELFDTMDRLGYPMPQILGVSMILTSLSKDYDQFVQNYNMHSMGKTIAELHNMLKLAEKGMPKKAPLVLAINQGRIQKKNKGKPLAPGKGQGKDKARLAYAPKPKIPPPAKKEHPATDTVCHHCGVVGHWRRNCAAYLEGLKKKKASGASTSEASIGWDKSSLSEDDEDVPALLVPPGSIAGSKGLNFPLKLLFMFAKSFILNGMTILQSLLETD
ncbi:zinc finger, CCHC-type [Artemisia annua]|uniref:Zinc finger, CCHC-type n=1 Tax=Artemisia annua TaxID=35608 RepID=A0A2U1Q0L3_ARTAN|nr:zinc finger, CCHC-type [Artemisia annua]